MGFSALLTLVSATFLPDKMAATTLTTDSEDSVNNEKTFNENNHDDSTKV